MISVIVFVALVCTIISLVRGGPTLTDIAALLVELALLAPEIQHRL